MQPVFDINHVDYSYHTLQGATCALSDVTFQIFPGEFVAIVGPSGCGKSTLLNLLTGLIKPEQGQILFLGEPLQQKNTAKIGYMLQQDQLFEWRTILKNVLLGPEIQKTLTPDTIEQAKKLLHQYGLGAFASARPSQLSGGMRQRAALVRTLILKPEVLLLDEPFSALDYQTRLNVANDIGMIIKQEKHTAILVTHDLSEAVSLADHILVLSRRPGKVKTWIHVTMPKELSPRERRNHPAFKDYYNELWKELNDESDGQ